MNYLKRKKGVILMFALIFMFLCFSLAAAYIATITGGFKIAKRSTYSLKAFFLAESGIHKALYELRKSGGWENFIGRQPVSSIDWDGVEKGQYEVDVAVDGVNRRIVSDGYFPGKNALNSVKRSIEAVMSAPTPNEFYDNAITAGQNIELNGNSYTVNGEIRYGDSIDPEGLGQQSTGDFPLLNFEQIKSIAMNQIKPNGQNNLYTQADLDGGKPFPASYWYDSPANTIPNVVYIESNLVLNGNVGTICGFFVVAGDVLTNPSGGADTTINGNGTVDGCVYTLGDFRINGGGSGLGVTGGVWSRDDLRLNGNATVSFSQNFMDGIENLNIGFVAQIISWQEKY